MCIAEQLYCMNVLLMLVNSLMAAKTTSSEKHVPISPIVFLRRQNNSNISTSLVFPAAQILGMYLARSSGYVITLIIDLMTYSTTYLRICQDQVAVAR